MGNVCRSPAIAAYVRKVLEKKGLSDQFYVDSAGVSGYFFGHPPDKRMVTAALLRGIEIEHESRTVQPEDFSVFHLIVPLTKDIEETLLLWKPQEAEVEIFSAEGREISDPYYNHEFKFEKTLDEIEQLGNLIVDLILEKKE